jgi:transposase
LDGADVLLPDNEGRTVIADKGYDAMQRVVAPALRTGKTVVIPTIRDGRQQRHFDRSLYRLRHHIENFFARLKQWRGIATRYDKTARSFLGAIQLVCALDWLAPFTDTP